MLLVVERRWRGAIAAPARQASGLASAVRVVRRVPTEQLLCDGPTRLAGGQGLEDVVTVADAGAGRERIEEDFVLVLLRS